MQPLEGDLELQETKRATVELHPTGAASAHVLHPTKAASNGNTEEGTTLRATTLSTLAIIVSFRADDCPERHDHLDNFIEHMSGFLGKLVGEGLIGHVCVVSQSNDGRKFNRGKLLNYGFRFASSKGSYASFIFHDVDLLPDYRLAEWYAK